MELLAQSLGHTLLNDLMPHPHHRIDLYRARAVPTIQPHPTQNIISQHARKDLTSALLETQRCKPGGQLSNQLPDKNPRRYGNHQSTCTGVGPIG